MRAVRPQLDEFFIYSLSLLSYRSLIVVYMAFEQAQGIPVHWIYLVDKSFKFNRVTEQKNMSAATAPPGRTMGSAERGCYYDDELWRTSDEELFDMARQELAQLPEVDMSGISMHHVVRLQDAYPVYDLDFDRNLKALLAGLSAIPNLYSFGRQGMFLQNDMHDSMENGRILAEKIASGTSSAEWYDGTARVGPAAPGDYCRASGRQSAAQIVREVAGVDLQAGFDNDAASTVIDAADPGSDC